MRRFVCPSLLCTLTGLILGLAGCFVAPAPAHAQQKAGKVSYINDIAPILKESCCACHLTKVRKGKFDMSTYESFRKGGINDDPVEPGKPAESRLVSLLKSKGKDRMPPPDAGEALSKAKIDLIERWIKEGAHADISPKADMCRELRLRWEPPSPPAAYKYPVNINALVFTPDNKKLVVGGYHELTVWDVGGKLVERLYTRAERAYGMAFLPDGKLAVAGGRPGQEGDVRIYNLNAPGKDVAGVKVLDGVHDKTVLVKELLETDDSMLCLAVSADGKKLASGGCDRLVRVWDLQTAKLEHSIENHADWVFGVAFSPDGKYLITGSRDKTAKVWDLAAKESLLTFPDHQNTVYAVAMTADGKTGMSVGEDNNLRFWQATDAGKQLGKQTKIAGGHVKAVFKIARSHDPKKELLATCSADKTVRLWKVTGTDLKPLTGHTDWVYAVALSPDDSMVASGSWNGEVRIWKTADGSPVSSFNASPGYMPAAVQSSKKE